MMPIRILLFFVFVVTLPVSKVVADELLLELRPEPGVGARVVREPNWQVTLRQPFGDNIPMPRPNKRQGLGLPPPELRQIDIDFDGHPDLAVHFPEARQDDLLQIIRYRPAERRYETLQLPRNPEPHCDWRDAVQSTGSQALMLSCRRGLSQIRETVRFNSFGSPWLETRHVEGGLLPVTWYPNIPIASHVARWNDTGQELDIEAYDEQGQGITLIIPVQRAPLYMEAGLHAASPAYLVRGDRVKLLDLVDDWIRIRYESTSGMLDRWLWLPEAFDLAAQAKFHDVQNHDGLTLSSGPDTPDSAPGPLSEVFPITLDNNGETSQSLHRPQLHLIFRTADGSHPWVENLANRASVTIEPGQRHVIETGPPELGAVSYMLSHPEPNEFEIVIDLFPAEVPPGKYRVQAVLTSPSLHAPLYADEKTFFHILPETLDYLCTLTEQPEPIDNVDIPCS